VISQNIKALLPLSFVHGNTLRFHRRVQQVVFVAQAFHDVASVDCCVLLEGSVCVCRSYHRPHTPARDRKSGAQNNAAIGDSELVVIAIYFTVAVQLFVLTSNHLLLPGKSTIGMERSQTVTKSTLDIATTFALAHAALQIFPVRIEITKVHQTLGCF
jgi:hypothetical protein